MNIELFESREPAPVPQKTKHIEEMSIEPMPEELNESVTAPQKTKEDSETESMESETEKKLPKTSLPTVSSDTNQQHSSNTSQQQAENINKIKQSVDTASLEGDLVALGEIEKVQNQIWSQFGPEEEDGDSSNEIDEDQADQEMSQILMRELGSDFKNVS